MSDENFDTLFEIIEDENHIPDVAPTQEEFDSAEQILNSSEEAAAQIKEELEQLESPLIVHKVTDASYQEAANDVFMDETHTEDEGPTLERHRFRKEKKKGGNGWKVILLLVVVAAAVFAGLYYSGAVDLNKNETTTKKVEQTTETTTSLEQAYQGKILLKGTYIFVDGVEVDGINGLQQALKYEDPSPTAYEIVKEDANSDFLNNDILPLLGDMGFYNEQTVITTVAKSGLVAAAELTTVQTTTQKPTEAPTQESE